MCGVSGFYLESPSQDDFEMIKNVIVQSMIRGKHATGISFVKDGKIITIKEPIPADVFVDKHMQDAGMFISKNQIKMIAHSRYSTSDLLFNQPISSEKFSLVHNGVISQEPETIWKDLYGVECKGKNDSELLFMKHDDVFSYWPDSSIAAIELSLEHMRFYRNGKRPLYYSIKENGFIITSTYDIMNRVNKEIIPFKTDSNCYYTIADFRTIEKSNREHYHGDYQ